MNDNIKLEDLISKYMTDNIKLLVTKDWQNINTGNIIVKNCSQMKKLLVDIYKQTQFINTGWWEQASFIYLYYNNSYKIFFLYFNKYIFKNIFFMSVHTKVFCLN